jgi:hypothetical protein
MGTRKAFRGGLAAALVLYLLQRTLAQAKDAKDIVAAQGGGRRHQEREPYDEHVTLLHVVVVVVVVVRIVGITRVCGWLERPGWIWCQYDPVLVDMIIEAVVLIVFARLWRPDLPLSERCHDP